MTAIVHLGVFLAGIVGAAEASVPITTLDGRKMRVENFGERPLTAFVAMSTQCPATIAAIPELNRLQGSSKYRLRNVLFVGLFPNSGENGEAVRDFVHLHGAHFPVYRDIGQAAVKQLGLTATPSAVIADRNGKIVFRTGLETPAGIKSLEFSMIDLLADRAISASALPMHGTGLQAVPASRPAVASSPLFRSELLFERIEGAPTHHCSTIAEFGDGELVCVWYGGSYESADDQTLFLARRPAGKLKWKAPEIVHRDSLLPPGNAIAFVDARDRLHVLWGRMESTRPIRPGGGWGNCRLFLRTSLDRGRTWSADRAIESDLFALPRNPPIRIRSGALLVPVSGDRGCFFVATSDECDTWQRSEFFRGGSQPTIIERRDGSLLALLRHAGRVHRATTADGGKTWSTSAPTEVPNPGAGICAVRLRSGKILLACNNVANARTPLSVLASSDEGESWTSPVALESAPGEFSYPCIIQTADDNIHVTYTYQRLNVKHVEFNEAWLSGAGVPPAAIDEQKHAGIVAGLGGRSRKIATVHPEAQAYFDRGMAYLFAFNHDEAIRAFETALARDENCAMAHWGIGLAHGPHINNTTVPAERNAAAIRSLKSAASLSAGSSLADRALIEAAAKRYADPPPDDRSQLNRAYAEAMKAAWERFGDDADIGALYAEAAMNLRPWDLWTSAGQPQPGTNEIVATLEKVLQLAPNHPLALHLYIHAIEASPNPGKAAAVGDRLRALAPKLGHLVHMPSHIDVRTGEWQKAVETNRRAIAADGVYALTSPKQGFYRVYMAHNLHMLSFAATMRGQSAVAVGALRTMIAAVPADWVADKNNAAIVDGFLAMPIETLMRFGRWEEVLKEPEPAANFPIARALRHFCRGSAFAALGKVADARAEADALRAATALTPKEAFYGNNAAADLLAIAKHVLEGEILLREGKVDAGLDSLRQGVALEDKLKYDEPPDWIQPVRHALGAALVANGRPEEAEAVYREDLKKWPNNGWSLFGLAQSCRMQGKSDEADKFDKAFAECWRDADVKLKASCFCQSPR